ncbi:MAG: HAD family hydrolase, partial [Myxococcales bacterium]|nr:HAD family hydrolase [Myxococcales bacterium]
LLLDLDDTLIDRSAALRAWLRRKAGVGLGDADGLLRLDGESGGDLAMLSLELLRLRPGLAGDPLALGERIRRELPGFIARDEAVQRTLQTLQRAGVPLVLVSNGGGETQRAKLAAAGLDPQTFAAVLISGEVGLAKPEPALFRLALARLGTPAEATVMIGDSLHEDIAGAEAVGVAGCWIRRGRPLPAPAPRWAEDFSAAVAGLGWA